MHLRGKCGHFFYAVPDKAKKQQYSTTDFYHSTSLTPRGEEGVGKSAERGKRGKQGLPLLPSKAGRVIQFWKGEV